MERLPGALTLGEDDRRVLAAWAADCAERTMSLFEAQAPSDTRPRDAVDGLRGFARGDMRIGQVRALAARAHAAAREVGDPAALRRPGPLGRRRAWPTWRPMRAVRQPTPRRPPGWSPRTIPTAAADEVGWQLRHASPNVRDVLRKPPPPTCPAGMLGALIDDLRTKLAPRPG
jgi:hypothetical protein